MTAAILLSALEDLRGVGPATAWRDNPQNLKRRESRVAFLQAQTAGSLWCCDLLGLDPEAVTLPFLVAIDTRAHKLI